ncbi:MAG: hypothetical protein K0R01_3298, partial [Mycobacterium sp.]|nr:hypothetical protein [Mycobacterium sp.]
MAGFHGVEDAGEFLPGRGEFFDAQVYPSHLATYHREHVVGDVLGVLARQQGRDGLARQSRGV